MGWMFSSLALSSWSSKWTPVAHARRAPHPACNCPGTPRCRFTVQVPAWAPGWLATARLRFSAPPPSPQATPDPQALQPSIASTPVTSMATSAADVSERHPASLAVATSSTTISTQVLNQATEVPLSTAGPGTVNGTAINSKVLSQETEVLEVPLSLTGSRTAGGGDRVAGLRFQEGGSPSDCQQGEDVIQQPGRQQQEQLSMPEAQQQQKPLQLPRPHTRNLRPVPPASRHQLPTGMDNREPRLSLTHSWCQSACIQKCGTLPQGEGCDLVPFFTIPLWNGGRFDAGYNARQQELQVRLVAL